MKKKNLLPMKLQFFAEEGSGNANDDSGKDSANNNNGDEGNKDQTDSGEKTFTQSQVSAMMAKEKNEGKKSILKSLGFNTEDEAKDAFKLLKALKDSQKTAEEIAKENEDKHKKEIEEANLRASEAESKLACLENGVDKNSIDDILAIASLKVTKDKSLSDVIKEMKKDNKYSSFFVSGSNGTGSTPGHSNSSDNTVGEYGKKLAERNKSSNKETKTSYFD